MTRLLALLLSVSLLLPAMGGAVAVLAGAQSVVLCIGSERVRVTLDADGVPVDASVAVDQDCLVAPASRAAGHIPSPDDFAFASIKPDTPVTLRVTQAADPNPVRAPPRSA